MTEEEQDKDMEEVRIGGEKPSVEKAEVETRTELDIDELLSDFGDFLTDQRVIRTDYFNKILSTVIHMMLAVLTMGTWIFVYVGYYLFKFYTRIELEDYRKQVKYVEKPVEE